MMIPLESGEIVEAWPAPDEISALEANIDRIDLSGIEAPPDIARYELFAVLALT